MKQSTVTALGGTPLAIRFSNNSNSAGVTATATASPGVTYVLQSQQSKPGVLRPVSFVPQLQQINGGGSGVSGTGSQVLIRRFPNNNVVHVRRIANQQQQQPQQQQKQFQRVMVQQASPGGNILTAATANNVSVIQARQQMPVSATIGGGGNNNGQNQSTSSEPESDEFEGEGSFNRGEPVVHKSQNNGGNVHLNGGNSNNVQASNANAEGDGDESEGGHKTYSKLLTLGKRKRVDDDCNDDEDDGDLLVDHEEDDQDGDVIDDDDGEERDEKSALELNGAGVDSGFLRHVVETQILNRHKTRIKDWDGTKGHMCQSCHETFLSESGLETHRNRRIHHILFFCRHCKRDLSFFNKCRLLQHLRNHRATPSVSTLQNCIMIRLLPESEYLHFKYEECTSSSDDDDEEIKTSSSPISTGGGGGGGGGGNSSCNGSSSPPKRSKPSRFRRIARSSVTGRDSDNSPPPNISRQIVAPPQLSSPPLSVEHSTTTIVSTLNQANNCNADITVTAVPNNNHSGGTTGASVDGEDSSPYKNCQLTTIKSVGNTSLPNLSSPNNAKPGLVITASGEKESSASNTVDSSDSPQIRIRNLSHITVSVNDEDDDDDEEEGNNENLNEFEGEDDEDSQELAPVIHSQVVSNAKPSVTVSISEASPSSVIVAKKEYRCYKCDSFYGCAADLFKHLEEAEQVGLTSRSLHRCPTDDIPSWSQCQYVFHTKVFHERSVPFMCPGCGVESPDYNRLLEHVTNDCFYLSQRARYMCAATVSKCSFSDRKSVQTEPEIIDHLKKEHSRSVLQCLHCTQGFATDNWLLKHLSETHGIIYDEKQGASEREALINKTTRPLTQCLICNILFPNGPTYLQHVYLNFHMHILHAKMLECQNCFEVFETHQEILTHRKENESCRKLDPFSMRISEGAASNEDGKEGEVATTCSVAPTPIKIVTNPAAVTVTPTKSGQSSVLTHGHNVAQRSHQLGDGSTAIVTVLSSASSPNIRLQPPKLSPQVSPPRSHTVQQKQSSSNQISSSQTITSPQQNSNNARNVTNNSIVNNRNMVGKKTVFDDLLSCQFCDRLVVFSSLRKHEDQCCGLSTVDPGFCLTCKQYFGDKIRLARHGIVHIKEGLPICLFCNNRHIRPTHPKSTTPSAHENLYALKKHLYSNHTSKIIQFPFKCTICSTSCTDKRACEFHIKDHQFKFQVNSDNPDPLPINVSQEDLQKMVKVRRKGLDPKKKAITKIIEVYYCPVCKNREFALESGLSRHLKLVHQKNPKSLNLSLLKKASTARRFVVKAPEAPSVLGMGMQHSSIKPLLRSVVNNGGGLASSLVSASPPKGRVSSASTPATGNTVTVSSSSSTNSFTSRFSSGIVLRKRLVSTTTATSNTARRVGTSGVVLPQRQLPNTRQRSASTTTTTSVSKTTSTASTTTTTASSSASSNNRPASNFLHTRSLSSTLSTKSCRKKDGTIVCLKCPEFSCKTENEFCSHVKWKHVWPDSEIDKLKFGNKLEEPSEYWCPECNTTFVAKPSLVRHLKYAHDYITSAEAYMLKIGYDGKKPLKPYQCEVCYYQCADDREQQQHIRTHGMAFLRLRQQRQLSMANNK